MDKGQKDRHNIKWQDKKRDNKERQHMINWTMIETGLDTDKTKKWRDIWEAVTGRNKVSKYINREIIEEQKDEKTRTGHEKDRTNFDETMIHKRLIEMWLNEMKARNFSTAMIAANQVLNEMIPDHKLWNCWYTSSPENIMCAFKSLPQELVELPLIHHCLAALQTFLQIIGDLQEEMESLLYFSLL